MYYFSLTVFNYIIKRQTNKNKTVIIVIILSATDIYLKGIYTVCYTSSCHQCTNTELSFYIYIVLFPFVPFLLPNCLSKRWPLKHVKAITFFFFFLSWHQVSNICSDYNEKKKNNKKINKHCSPLVQQHTSTEVQYSRT